MFYKNLLISLTTILVLSCGDNLSGGSGDDIGNGYISGSVKFAENDTTPKNITVKLIPVNFNPLTDTLPKEYIDEINILDTFKIGPIDTGKYNLISFSDFKTYSSINANIEILNNDTFINQILDSSITLSIFIPDSLHDTTTHLYLIGTDEHKQLTNISESIEFKLPESTFVTLMLSNDSLTLLDTLTNSLIHNDSNIVIIDSLNVITSSFTFWNSVGIVQGIPIDMLRDSTDNMWAIFEDRVVGILFTDIDSINIVNYDKSILGTNIDKITCGSISPWGDILLGTSAQGIISGNVSQSGIITALDQIQSTGSSFISSDTISSIGFKDDSTIFIISSDTLRYGNFLSNNLEKSIFLGANSDKGFFFYDSLLIFTSDGLFKELNLNNSSFTDDIIYFNQNGGTITSFNKGNNNNIYLGLKHLNSKEAVFLDGNNSLIHRYNLSIVSDSIVVKSATNDINNNDWFGMSNGEFIYVTNQNDSEAKIINNSNSQVLLSYGPVVSMAVNSNNFLFAAMGQTGFAVLDLNTLP